MTTKYNDRKAQRSASSNNLRNRANEEEVLRLRVESRMPQAEIAERLGITQSSVSRILHRQLRECAERRTELGELLLEEELEGIDAICRRAHKILEDDSASKREQLAAMDFLLKAGERRQKLCGLDMPLQVEHSFRQEPMTAEEIAKMRETATAEELQAIAAGNHEVMIAVLSRAGVPLH